MANPSKPANLANQQLQDTRPLLNLVNAYKSQITDLEIKNANYAVALDDLRAENEQLVQQLQTLQESMNKAPAEAEETEELELPLEAAAEPEIIPPSKEKPHGK